MTLWQAVALYLVAAGLVTFLITLFFGDLDGDPPPLLLGMFWPVVLVLAVIAIPFGALAAIQALAKKAHELTKTEDTTHD